MKNVFATLAVLAALFAGEAVSHAQMDITYSLGAGVTGRTYLFAQPGVKTETALAPGLSLDFESNFRPYRNFAFSAGASLVGTAGYHLGGNTALNLGEIHLDIPIHVKVYVPLGEKVEMCFFGGLTPEICLVSVDAHAKGTTDNFKTNPNLQRFNLLAGAGLGLEIIRHIKVSIGYDQGLVDRDKSAERKSITGLAKVSVAYIF